jgi:hypothetical protein
MKTPRETKKRKGGRERARDSLRERNRERGEWEKVKERGK